jgi:hypothetical protein
MKAVGGNLVSPYAMTAYRMRDFDIVFYGDTAFITYVADLDIKTPNGTGQHTLRVADLYVKQNGNWIQAGSNTAIHPDSLAEQLQMPQKLSGAIKKQLLETREAVWRAYFGTADWKVRRSSPRAAANWSNWNFRRRRFSVTATRRASTRRMCMKWTPTASALRDPGA